MSKRKNRYTPGQKLWVDLYRADLYASHAERVVAHSSSPRHSPESATKHWLEGMSRHMKERFSTELRKCREKLGVTQERLADIADLSSTAVAMIERGERVPNLITATQLCWALDVAACVTKDELA